MFGFFVNTFYLDLALGNIVDCLDYYNYFTVLFNDVIVNYFGIVKDSSMVAFGVLTLNFEVCNVIFFYFYVHFLESRLNCYFYRSGFRLNETEIGFLKQFKIIFTYLVVLSKIYDVFIGSQRLLQNEIAVF